MREKEFYIIFINIILVLIRESITFKFIKEIPEDRD